MLRQVIPPTMTTTAATMGYFPNNDPLALDVANIENDLSTVNGDQSKDSIKGTFY